jgi:non-specific serine/threonine protein kinase/NIMA (never in mitosis gene a)-related kinase
MEIYEVVKSIGSGSFGQVYQVRSKYDGLSYVVKKIKTRDMSDKDRENTEQEVRLLQKMRHANIVAYKDSYIDREQFLCIVMVYCEGGDIYSKIQAAKGRRFSETQVMDWFAQILLALLYLHEKRILHRDLKTQNIFLKNERVKLGDFGIAKVLDGTKDFANTCIGTPYYMSPELFKNKPYSYKSDVWALGCVVYEMCNLRHAFDAQSLNGLAMKILKGNYPPISPTYSKVLRDLIGSMLNVNPSQRPSLLDILKVPIVKKHVVSYLRECLIVNPGSDQEVDEVSQMSLRDQAEKLGLMGLVSGDSRLSAAPVKNDLQIEAKLKKEEQEKQQLEEELKRVAEQRSQLKRQIHSKKSRLQSQQQERANVIEKNSRQKLLDAEKRREQILADRKKRANFLSKKPEESKANLRVQVEEERLVSKVEEFREDLRNALVDVKSPVETKLPELKHEAEVKVYTDNRLPISARDRVLMAKEQRRREEESKISVELRKIRQDNIAKRVFAHEKYQAEFRSSAVAQTAFGDAKQQLAQQELEEDLDSVEEDSDEEEQSDQLLAITQHERMLKEKLEEKTMRIEEMRESLRFLRYDEEEPTEEVSLPLISYELEQVPELEEEEAKDEPLGYTKIREKMKLLRQ